MADPVGSTAAGVLGASAATVVALLGVEPQTLVYAALGAFVGLGLAPKTGPLRAACLFAAVTLLAAAIGTWAAAEYLGGRAAARNVVAAIAAAFFHPVFAAAAENVPRVVGGILARFGGGSK